MNRVILQLADLGWPKVAVASLFALGIYFFAIRDDVSVLRAQLRTDTQTLEDSRRQLAATKKAMDNAQRFEAQVNAAKGEFERVYEFMPTRMSGADLTTLISEKAASAGVKLISTSPKMMNTGSATYDKNTFFESVQVTFKIEGAFSRILGFLSAISKDSRLLTFENTELTSAGLGAPENPVLSFSGELIGYRMKKTTSPTPTSNGAPDAPK